MGPRGRFSDGADILADLASHLSEVKEAHHFYPVLYYFRFREHYYSVPRSALLALDTVTLIESALDEEEHGWVKNLATVTQLARASMMLVGALEQTFLSDGPPSPGDAPDEATLHRWRRRYAGAHRLRQAGITVAADQEAAQETYIRLRSQWDRHIATLAGAMAFDAKDIDPAGANPDAMMQRPPGHARHSRFQE